MATSPNFSWPEPDNSDLVKNGALAIRTAVDAIDSSMADLKGGTTGQVLSKTSNTDMDFTWVAQDDSNAIQNAIVDAKGDLIAATAADTPARLAVGTNGQVLTADSTAATGLAWTTVSGGASGPAYSAYRSGTTQSVGAATFTKMQLNAEFFDTDSCYDPSTLYRFTPTKAGKYQIDLVGEFDQSSASRCIFAIYKNGSSYVRVYDNTTSYAAPTGGGSVIIDMNGSTDYIEAYVYSGATGTVGRLVADGSGPVISGVWIRS